MRVTSLGLLILVLAAVGCGPSTPTPAPIPVVCDVDGVSFEKKGNVHDDYQVVCVENGGYYLYLTLNNEADETFRVNLWQKDKKQKELYSVGIKTLSEAAVALFTVCSSDCDAEQGQVRIEVDAPDAPANVEWAIRVEKKDDST